MKLAHVIEAGLTGTSTLALLQETLHGIDGKMPRALPYKPEILKKLRKQGKKGNLNAEAYIRLAGELLASTAFFGLTGLGGKKNAPLRGGLLGAAAGIGAAFLQHPQADETEVLPENRKRNLWHQVGTVGLYTAGGLLAGLVVKHLDKKLKGKKKRRK